MFAQSRRHDYQPLRRSSLDPGANNIEPISVDDDYYKYTSQPSGPSSRCCWSGRWRWRRSGPGGRWKRLLLRCLNIALTIIGFLLIVTPIFNPSYSTRPGHYTGSNPNNERVFIAANIIDSALIRGAWGKAVLELIDIIGNENVFLSIYENDSGEDTKEALREFSAKVKCGKAIVSSHIDVDGLPKVQILPNEKRVKRIAYLSMVRNHALDPLDSASSHDAVKRDANSTFTIQSADSTHFDRLLFLNDVVFSPKDAADLLFATNRDADGRASYHAACAMDYINAFKFYDRFAMRDNELYQVGVPFYPWFTAGGRGESFSDVMRGLDAVRVTSCWGGMVAFEAKWFSQRQLRAGQEQQSGLEPLRFRSEPDVFWEASECCLIHADLQQLVERAEGASARAHIFVNPFVRVAYDPATFRWLELTRRWERLFVGPHLFVSWLIRMPWEASRRLERPGERVERREWVYTGPEFDDAVKAPAPLSQIAQYGMWRTVKRTATSGGYCGYDFFLSLKPTWKKGESMWEKIAAPPGS